MREQTDGRTGTMHRPATRPRWNDDQFRRLLEHLPAGAYTCDPDGLITYYNREAAALWGRAPKLNDPEDRFCGSFRLFSSDGEPIRHDQCWMARALRDDAGYNGQEIVVERPDGRRFTALAHANPVHDEAGLLLGAVNVLVDIAERKRAEEALAEVNRQLEERNRETEQFVYSVSHDLKNPLVTINGFVGILRESILAGDTDAALDALARVEKAGERMSVLIGDLLELSRVGRVRNRPEELDVAALVREVADGLRERLEAAGATLHVEDGLPRLYADPLRISQLFENLLANAVKYGCPEPGGRIVVGSVRATGELRYFVRDCGPGIAPEYHRKVFALFQRLDTNAEGTGIGLTLVERIAGLYGGRVWIESEPGAGATFWIAFPARTVAPPAG